MVGEELTDVFSKSWPVMSMLKRFIFQIVIFTVVLTAAVMPPSNLRGQNPFQDEIPKTTEEIALGKSEKQENPLREPSSDALEVKDTKALPLVPPSVTMPLPVRTFTPAIAAGTLDELHGPLLRRDLKIESATSCAAASCHGGPSPGISAPDLRRGNEYSLWFENDPHARSWHTICSDASLRMMTTLKILDGDKIIDRKGFDNCLACHNTAGRYDDPRTAERLREGVGCAGCHGPSEQWSGTHFQQGWAGHWATGQGFVNNEDLMTRARMCASCHIGDKDRDMNHDIIAAGHPALRYELATYHAWQPKHWRDIERDDRKYYEAQLWLTGQIAAADASLSLLESRAAKGHTVSQWPELAAFDCASCHHQLGFDNARPPVEPSLKAVAKFSSWNDAGLHWLIQYRMEMGEGCLEDGELLQSLDLVKSLMEAKSQSDADQVASAAGHARQALARWLASAAGSSERHGFRSDRLAQVVATAAGRRSTFQTWESAVQFYLAAVAARESWPGGWQGPLFTLAEELRLGLRYPDGQDLGRFEKRSTGTTMNRQQAMQIGIELAGWLGPVQIEPDAVLVDDEQESERMEADLQRTLKRIDDRWSKIIETWRRELQVADEKAKEAKVDDVPEAKPMSREEMLEELRKRFETYRPDEDRDEASENPSDTPNPNGEAELKEDSKSNPNDSAVDAASQTTDGQEKP
jgi:hypothetical protein